MGSYLPSSGVWHHTQRHLKRGASNTKTIHHLDFDAPTREHSQQLPDDKVLSQHEKFRYLHIYIFYNDCYVTLTDFMTLHLKISGSSLSFFN